MRALLDSTKSLSAQGLSIAIAECCEPFNIPYVYEDPTGPRARAFHSITHALSVAWYSRALEAVLTFAKEYGRFSPDEVSELIAIDQDREDELNEQLESVRQCHVMIQYDLMALRLQNLPDDLRTTLTTRVKGFEANLAHDMESLTHIGRGLGIIGAIVLDQR